MRLRKEDVDAIVRTAPSCRTITELAQKLGLPRTTLASRIDAIRRSGMVVRLKPEIGAEITASRPAEEWSREELLVVIEGLKAELAAARRGQSPSLDEAFVKSKILQLANSEIIIPQWLSHPHQSSGVTGVPTLLASDWHWGEVVSHSQVNGVNEFNLEVAHRRVQRLIEHTIELCFGHIANPKYDGIVFALGGDMLSGNIHDELEATNERPIMPTAVDLVGVLIRCISRLAEAFGRVFVPAVAGNHGRYHRKPRAKNRAFENFDWLVYQMVAKRFEGDERVSFLIPDGIDCVYSVYNHRYALMHGDQFTGGDGIIGMLGPVTRGDMKKRAYHAQIDLEYDTLLLGHWHQLHMGSRVIVNGSLIGYSEYSKQGSYPYEIPQQALWITHPREGITFRMEVHLEDRKGPPAGRWVEPRS